MSKKDDDNAIGFVLALTIGMVAAIVTALFAVGKAIYLGMQAYRAKKCTQIAKRPELEKEQGAVVFQSPKQKVVEVGEIKGRGDSGVSISLIINRSSEDEEVSAHHREATQLKDAGNLNKAIAALQKAQNLMRRSNVANTTEGWLRLPLFLQQGGRFDEAMEEFNRLLVETDARIAKEFSHQPEFAQHGFTHHVRATIYDKMRVACKRQKLPDEVEKYKALSDEFLDKHEKFQKVWKKYDDARSAKQIAEIEKKAGIKISSPAIENQKYTAETTIRHDQSTGDFIVETDWEKQFQQIDQARRSGDYDFARVWLQKFAYTITGNDSVSQEVKDRFKRLMTEFAKEDPLYREVMAHVKPLVMQQPGIVQSTIYKKFPHLEQETIRYVLYFAHEIGDITRRKKGRSYELMPPGQVIEGEVVK